MTKYDDFKRFTIDTTIKDIQEEHWYAFEDTVFYGDKGGMPSDTGTINGQEVIDLKWVNDTLYHQVKQPLSNPIHMEIDKERRYYHTAPQTALHILDSYYKKKGQYIITTNCLIGHSYYEVDTKPIHDDELKETEDYIREAIRSATPVTYRYIKGSEYPDPEYQHFDTVRIVDIGDWDSQPCGTPHVSNTLEIGSFVILKTEPTNRGTKIYFACGVGCEDKLKEDEHILKDIQNIVKTPINEMTSKIKTMKDSLKEANTKLQTITRAWMEDKANTLPNDTVIELEELDDDAARTLAQIMIKKVNKDTVIFSGKKFMLLSPSKKARDIYNTLCQSHACRGGGSPIIVIAESEENIHDDLIKLM